MITKHVKMTHWRHFNDGEVYKEPAFLITWYVFGFKIWSKKFNV